MDQVTHTLVIIALVLFIIIALITLLGGSYVSSQVVSQTRDGQTVYDMATTNIAEAAIKSVIGRNL